MYKVNLDFTKIFKISSFSADERNCQVTLFVVQANRWLGAGILLKRLIFSLRLHFPNNSVALNNYFKNKFEI